MSALDYFMVVPPLVIFLIVGGAIYWWGSDAGRFPISGALAYAFYVWTVVAFFYWRNK